MTREELLNEIIEAVEPEDTITEDTVIADCFDLDSLGLFNIVLMLKGKGFNPTLAQLQECEKVSDIIDIALGK